MIPIICHRPERRRHDDSHVASEGKAGTEHPVGHPYSEKKMASAPARPQAVDTSPEAINARRVAAVFAKQDEALRMREAGSKPVEIGRAMKVATWYVHHLIGAASDRRACMEHSRVPCDLDALALTDGERVLMEALVKEQFELWEGDAVRSPETKAVAWHARRSHGWVASTARRRIDENVIPPRPKTEKGSEAEEKPKKPRFGARVVTPYQPGLGLVRIAGNGYINLTKAGWSAARALFPHRFPA